MPGFVDVHTHYDAEVLVAPSLSESVRHGVTTVLVGNCSISAVYSDPIDVADLFSRVEALPRDAVVAAMQEKKTWQKPQAIGRESCRERVCQYVENSVLAGSLKQ